MSVLLLLATHFLFLSLIAVGGASATLPEMHRVLVENLHLIGDERFSQFFSISQAAPGPNVLFVALFGWQIAGIPGAVVSMFSMCGPSSLLAIAVEKFGSKHQKDRWYLLIRRSLTPISIGLLLSTAVLLLKAAPKPTSIIITAATLIILFRFKLNPIWLIATGAVIGVLGWV